MFFNFMAETLRQFNPTTTFDAHDILSGFYKDAVITGDDRALAVLIDAACLTPDWRTGNTSDEILSFTTRKALQLLLLTGQKRYKDQGRVMDMFLGVLPQILTNPEIPRVVKRDIIGDLTRRPVDDLPVFTLRGYVGIGVFCLNIDNQLIASRILEIGESLGPEEPDLAGTVYSIFSPYTKF